MPSSSGLPPPQPRKIPSQKRSHATVAYIVGAARKILHEEGIAAITTRRVADRSGVGVGSLYQYFPNREAIIARLVEEEVRNESAAMQGFFNEIRGLPLPDFLAEANARLIQSERRMLALGGDFYRRYVEHFQVLRHVGDPSADDRGPDVETPVLDTRHSLEKRAADVKEADLNLAAYLLARGVPAMLRRMTAEQPELLDSPRLPQVMMRLLMAIVDGKDMGPGGNEAADPRR